MVPPARFPPQKDRFLDPNRLTICFLIVIALRAMMLKQIRPFRYMKKPRTRICTLTFPSSTATNYGKNDVSNTIIFGFPKFVRSPWMKAAINGSSDFSSGT